MKILIIEDEYLAQQELKRIILNTLPDAHIVAIIDSVAHSIQWLKENSADLIFMDIQLSDGISFDVFKSIEVVIPIIFTTAYDQYAIQAFKVNSISYLLKPIMEEDLINAINKFKSTPYYNNNISSLLSSLNKSYKSRISIKSGDKFSFIDIADVAYFYAEERVTFVVPKQGGRKQIVDYTIEALEQLLDPNKFFRVTRGCICSIDSIDNITKHFNSRLKVTLTPAFVQEILISRVRVPEFLKWIDGE
ncbi:MAG: LytTR family DNA-binding domain-containing protein [Bacteroidales bacterium]